MNYKDFKYIRVISPNGVANTIICDSEHAQKIFDVAPSMKLFAIEIEPNEELFKNAIIAG